MDFNDYVNAFSQGLSDFAGTIAGGISDKVFGFIAFIVDLVLFPINSLISAIFPDFSSFISTFSQGLTELATAPIGYIAYHIPPLTRSVIILYLTIIIAYYSILWTYRGIILIPTVINKIKFW